MNFEAIRSVATSKLSRQLLVTQKHSPKILFAAGTVGVIGTVVLACRATLKISDVLDIHEKKVNDLAALHPDNEDDFNKDVNKLKIKTGLDIVKPYIPAIGLGIASIGALTGSHVILTKRNTTTTAALIGMQKAYDSYRARVAAELGVDKEREFAYGAETHRVEEKTADGKTKLTESKVIKDPQIGGSPYAVVFDERSKFFTKEPGMNSNIVMMKQNYANDKLKAQGHLFLNEVYDLLDLPRTTAGALVGWVYNPKNEGHRGDNYVSFGVFDGDVEWVEAFMDGREKYAVLDFNVDGPIYELI